MKVLDRAQFARIVARWPTPEAFYGDRDDRTTRVVRDLAHYATRPLEIHVDPQLAGDLTVQRIALVVANLTARWARRVRVVLPDDVALAPELRRHGFGLLRERIHWEMAMADPFGNFEVGNAGRLISTLRLFVGPWEGRRAFDGDDYHVHAAGWSAFGRRGADWVARSPDLAREATVAAAGLAASLGAADLFKRAIGQGSESWMPTFAWDTWSSALRLGRESWVHVIRREVPNALRLCRTFLGGVGAIGSAFLYLADLGVMSGELLLLDRDRIEVSNLNRSPLFTVMHALDAVLKTAAGRDYFVGCDLRVDVRDGTWREHAGEIAAQPSDVWISLTNEDGAWAELPFHLPPVVLHATTTSGWGFGAGRHIPRLEDCTLCRMPRPAAEFRGPCAEGRIDEMRPEIRASLPFLSTAAASLLLATYMQLTSDGEATRLPNDIAADLGVGLRAIVALHRGPTQDCRGCRLMASHAWISRGGKGAFAGWSCV